MNNASGLDERLPKSEILRKRDDFRRAFEVGKRWQGRYLKAFSYEAEDRRMGFSVPKRIGKAVLRNRIRRWMREAYRKHKYEIGSFHIVLMAREGAGDAGMGGLEKDFIRFIQKGGISQP